MDIEILEYWFNFDKSLYEGCAITCPFCGLKSVHSEWGSGEYYYETYGLYKTIICPECGKGSDATVVLVVS